MEIEDFAYVVETEKSFDEAVVSVLREVESLGWTLFNVYDIRERLAVKGFEQKPLKIIEICSGKHANNFLNKMKINCLIQNLRDAVQIAERNTSKNQIKFFCFNEWRSRAYVKRARLRSKICREAT